MVMSLKQPAPPGVVAQAERALWFAAGCLALAVAAVGLVIPVMPAVPFVVLALMCFSRSSERSKQWLLRQPLFGPILRDWQAHHGVARRTKGWSSALLLISTVGAWWLMPEPWRWLPVIYAWLMVAWLWCVPTLPTKS